MFKKIASVLASMLVAALPMQAIAVGNVQIESAAMIANVTAGDTQYKKAVNAKVDEVVKVQVWYHNKEEANSGKIANNLKVKIDVPNQPGKSQVFTSTVLADNSNTVVDTTTANLSADEVYLEYIPGSAFWRHNKGTNEAQNWVTENISDNVVNGGVVLESAQPCFNFEATVTILARVKAQGVSLTKQVRKAGETEWKTETSANAGDTLEYQIRFKNEGNVRLNNLDIVDNLPPHVTYVPGSTMLKNGAFPDGIKITSDKIVDGGINVGNYDPGAVGYVKFQVTVNKDFTVNGCYDLKNVAAVRTEAGKVVYNTAITKVCVNTPPTPTTPQPTLPQTGGEVALAGVMGSAGIGYGVTAYRRSKKNLKDALRNIVK